MAFEHLYHVVVDVVKHFIFTLFWKLDKCFVHLVILIFFQFFDMVKYI
jgi:hypothetical protein